MGLGCAGGRYNNFGKSIAFASRPHLESQAKYYSWCRDESRFALGRSDYERDGGIDEQEEAQVKYGRKGKAMAGDSEAAERAIKMYNDAWYINKKLVVKHAWGINRNPRKRKMNVPPPRRHYQEQTNRRGFYNQYYGSIARSEKPGDPHNTLPLVVVEEVDDVWLKACAVGIIKENTKVDDIQEAITANGGYEITIKPLGENKSLIMFTSVEQKEAYLSTCRELLDYWFEAVYDWTLIDTQK
ncbi:hypothetical protein U1Q18_019542 [Sarracenia purpurea var. burkii]